MNSRLFCVFKFSKNSFLKRSSRLRLQVVVNALIQAIPSILNVLLVCLVFWLIFSIMGVNLFSGRYGRCVDVWGDRISHLIIENKTMCTDIGLAYNWTWEVPDISFDNVLVGYLALLQIVRIAVASGQ